MREGFLSKRIGDPSKYPFHLLDSDKKVAEKKDTKPKHTKKYDEDDGHWITKNGNHIFIEDKSA